MDSRKFQTLLVRLARALNNDDAPGAAACFTDDIHYSTPDRHYQGQVEIQQHINRTLTTAPVHLVWHHLLFDEETQVGSGEYTFSWNGERWHGVAIVKIADHKIARWRTYQTHSDLDWQRFVGENNF